MMSLFQLPRAVNRATVWCVLGPRYLHTPLPSLRTPQRVGFRWWPPPSLLRCLRLPQALLFFCCNLSPCGALSPVDDFMFGSPVRADDLHLLHHPLTQSEIANDTHFWRSAARVASAHNSQLDLVHWLQTYITEARAGRTVPDMNKVLPLMVDAMEQSAMTLEPAVRERLDAALHSHADLQQTAFSDYPRAQRQAVVQAPLSASLMPHMEASAALAAVPPQVVLAYRPEPSSSRHHSSQ